MALLLAGPVVAEPIVREQLPNGLRVVLVPDRSIPVAAVNVWYQVGGKDDPPGRSGFAHLFEHMMFKQAGSLPDEGLDRLTEDVGGNNNAFTSFDVTVYFESIPSNHLERLVWAESERLRALSVSDRNFRSEREVVKEERRQSYDNNPEGLAELALWELAYNQHPYRNSVIGSIAQLDSATLEEVQRFHNTYYQPQNAVLVLSGDLDPQEALGWVKKYFGPIPKGSEPPRITVQEPALKGPLAKTLTSALVSQPMVRVGYRIPSITSPDAAVLRLLPYLLTEGAASRLQRSLVTEGQVAITVASAPELLEAPGLFTISATARKPTLEPVTMGIEQVLAGLVQRAPQPEELARAKTKFLTNLLEGRQTPLQKALAVGEAELWFRDPDRVNSDPKRIMQITPEQVQRVVQAYFTPANRVTVSLLPQKG